MEPSAAGTSRTAPIPDHRPAELLLGGRPVEPSRIAALFLGGSLLVLVAGIGLNYLLTDGAWDTRYTEVTSAFGDGPTYLTSSTYDVASLGILAAALLALGVGFL